MTLPTFLGIGVPRGGTTWLHMLLASHPKIYMPTQRKELRFFDRDYAHGLTWYGRFFPSPEEAKDYQAIGEISPQYYKCEECPARILAALPAAKLIIMLRHPVDRAYSVYGFHQQRRNFKPSFEHFLAKNPAILEQGYYSHYLQRYLGYFPRTHLLALLFEDAIADPSAIKVTIANFLGIEAKEFPVAVGDRKVNGSTIPKNQFYYGLATKIGHQLHRWGMDDFVDFARRLNVEHFLSRGKPQPPLGKALRKRLSRAYQDEFTELERCLQLDLSRWREQTSDDLTTQPMWERGRS